MTLISIPKYAPINYVMLRFNGENQYVVAEGTAPFPEKEFTIEAWLRAPAGQTGTILSYKVGTDEQISIENPSKLTVKVNRVSFEPNNENPDNVSGGVDLSDGNWHYLALSWRSYDGRIVVHIDGKALASGVIAQGTSIKSGGTLLVGCQNIDHDQELENPYLGNLANLQIWNKFRATHYINQDMHRLTVAADLQLRLQQATAPGLKQLSSGGEVLFALNSAGLLLKSEDAAQSWQEITPDNETQETRVFEYIYALDDQYLLAVDTDEKLFISDDAGHSFTGLSSRSFRNIAGTSDALIALDDDGALWYSSDKGSKWTQPDPEVNEGVSLAMTVNAAFLAKADGSLHKSSDGGCNWIPLVNQDFLFKALAADPTGSDLLLALGTRKESDGLFLLQSMDEGNSFSPLTSAWSIDFSSITFRNNILWAMNQDSSLFQADIDAKTVLHWAISEGYGNVCFDMSGNNNHGILGNQNSVSEPEWQFSNVLSGPGLTTG